MPYASNSALPAWVKDMPSHAQDTYRKAFNAAYAQYKDDGKAAATAITAVKHKYEKRNGKWMRKRSLNGSDAFAVEPMINGIHLICSKGLIHTEDSRMNLSDRLPLLEAQVATICTDNGPIKALYGELVITLNDLRVSRSEAINFILGKAIEGAQYIYYTYDCELSDKSAEWIDRQRSLVASIADKYDNIKCIQNVIVNNTEDLINALNTARALEHSEGAVIKFVDGEDSQITSNISHGEIAFRHMPSFECIVESTDKIGDLYTYTLKGVENNTLPTDISYNIGDSISIRPTSIKITSDGTYEFIMPYVVPTSMGAVPLDTLKRYKEVELNMAENLITHKDGAIMQMPLDLNLKVELIDGTYPLGALYWSDVSSFKAPNHIACGILEKTPEGYTVIDENSKSEFIPQALVRKEEVLYSAEVHNTCYSVPASIMGQLYSHRLTFAEGRKNALKALSKHTDAFLIVDDKPCQWSYKLKYSNIPKDDKISTLVLNKDIVYSNHETYSKSGARITGELFFESNGKVYTMSILNPLDGIRHKLLDFHAGDSLVCTKAVISNAFSFLKNSIGMDDSVSLKDIMTYELLYDLASKPKVWFGVNGPVSFGGKVVHFMHIAHGVLEHGVKRTDFNEYKFDKIGRVVVSLIEESIACSESGAIETLWRINIPTKMQEWYAHTHNMDIEMAEVASKSYNVIWQAPGITTKTYFK